MIDHISIGVSDIAKTKEFYHSALKPLGYSCLSEGEGSLGYGKDETIQLWTNVAKKPVKADMDSGLHFCFAAPTRKSVDAFYKAAVAAGGRDNGKPGLREDYGPNYYAAYVIDPDGYRLEAYCSKAS
ncbi:VOC family protein [Ramlibacter tataouinensis]|uniref:Lactoylglutathione lyase (Aldoketomutase)-like protein n=1 Tax=Ramlibacter tataouinensis (strain ATCC BAA-407 / DSM 14655 / LMG 21543 / TTB310) TaxID=365046 RepID=F5Y635_RAMTT|nr:VOC family protein [Ramlibacter tataouinensis]AEG91539.1 lactoylglutathione lyase (Aldoketomutase)-like protein [Ramlibacter tataouinensis TTB310]